MSEKSGPSFRDELAARIQGLDDHLDSDVAEGYKDEPLAQDWARVAKAGEEVGEAIDALIGLTGQNPRKGHYGDMNHLLDELADVALTGMYGMCHFLKDGDMVVEAVMRRARHHWERIGLEFDG